MREADERWMRRALDLAVRGRATTSPNPMVGCVIVAGEQIVGEGWHERPGGPHAEVVALTDAGSDARGATAYVTLEPCAHTGRTPPCTHALVDAGVARVVVAARDGHLIAAGGADVLRAAGIAVDVGVCGDEARRQNAVHFHVHDRGRPLVVAKAAVSLDGRIAAADGTSRWLTGAEARTHAHRLRADAAAVLVGSGTVLADDPQLTVRLPEPVERQPLRVVLDRRGRLRGDHRVADASAPTLALTAAASGLAERLADTGVEVASVAGADDERWLVEALDTLLARGVHSVLVEGGSQVLGAFLRAGLVDTLVVYLAPVLLGEAARPAVVGPWPGTLDGAPRWRTETVERAGDDVVLTCVPAPGQVGAAETAAVLGTPERVS